MADFRLIMGYDGTEFHGSQVQAGVRTVQGELEQKLQQIGGGPARLAFAGRTDRGVHAFGQVASGILGWDGTHIELRSALNGVLPDDLVVSDVQPVDGKFHARFSARWREYRYRIAESPVPPVIARRYVWWRRHRIDSDLARQASSRLVGSHEFGSFASSGKSKALSPAELRRTVYACEWSSVDGDDVAMSDVSRLHELRIVADGFLPQMVRNIATAIVAVARGDQPVEWIDFLIGAGDRSALGKPAPPQGLFFWRVGYEAYENQGRYRPAEAGEQFGVRVV